jgi:hypothetical protein
MLLRFIRRDAACTFYNFNPSTQVAEGTNERCFANVHESTAQATATRELQNLHLLKCNFIRDRGNVLKPGIKWPNRQMLLNTLSAPHRDCPTNNGSAAVRTDDTRLVPITQYFTLYKTSTGWIIILRYCVRVCGDGVNHNIFRSRDRLFTIHAQPAAQFLTPFRHNTAAVSSELQYKR